MNVGGEPLRGEPAQRQFAESAAHLEGGLDDAFRAAGYSPEEIRLLTSSFKERVSELVNLPG